MPAETPEMELDLLRRFAKERGFYVNRHRQYDPARGGGDLYLMESKQFREEHTATILAYVTSERIYRWINQVMARRA